MNILWPSVNAVLNLLSLFFLLGGKFYILRQQTVRHAQCMGLALVASTFFLVSYLCYHQQVGSVAYPFYDWTRGVYFTVLLPHTVLAVINVPFIFFAVRFALRGQFDRHKKIVKYLWPSWVFVSLSGVVVYLMLYGYGYSFGLKTWGL